MTPQVKPLPSNDETQFWEVTSSDGEKRYGVMYDKDSHWICTCPDYYYRKRFCKHMKAVAEIENIEDKKIFEEVRNGSN